MPPYPRDSLSDVELAEIERYIRAFPRPKDPREIPLLAQQIEHAATEAQGGHVVTPKGARGAKR
jgi:hypothetical protein